MTMLGVCTVRVPADLLEAAQARASLTSTTWEEVVVHWIRVGREVERANYHGRRQTERVLTGAGSYDDLDLLGQAIVRAVWEERTVNLRADLDYETES